MDVAAWAFVRGTIARCSDLTQRRARHGSVECCGSIQRRMRKASEKQRSLSLYALLLKNTLRNEKERRMLSLVNVRVSVAQLRANNK